MMLKNIQVSVVSVVIFFCRAVLLLGCFVGSYFVGAILSVHRMYLYLFWKFGYYILEMCLTSWAKINYDTQKLPDDGLIAENIISCVLFLLIWSFLVINQLFYLDCACNLVVWRSWTDFYVLYTRVVSSENKF